MTERGRERLSEMKYALSRMSNDVPLAENTFPQMLSKFLLYYTFLIILYNVLDHTHTLLISCILFFL